MAENSEKVEEGSLKILQSGRGSGQRARLSKKKQLSVWSPETCHFLAPHLQAKKVNSLGKRLRTFQTFQECQPLYLGEEVLI